MSGGSTKTCRQCVRQFYPEYPAAQLAADPGSDGRNAFTSFEQYNKKTTRASRTMRNGITGYRQFEYPFIPRAEGSYTINPVNSVISIRMRPSM